MRLVRYRTTDLTRLASSGGWSAAGCRCTGRRRSWPTRSRPTTRVRAVWPPRAGPRAAVALLLSGPPTIAATAFAVTALIDRLDRLLGRAAASRASPLRTLSASSHPAGGVRGPPKGCEERAVARG